MHGKPRLLTQQALPDEPAADKRVREQKFPLSLLAKGMNIKLENGNASVEQDRTNILNIMSVDPATGELDTETDRIENANTALRGYFALAAWPQALKRGTVENFKLGDEPAFSLADILRLDLQRTVVDISFSGLDVTDADLSAIASGLPPNLERLTLSFESCGSITDNGVSYLAAKTAQLPLHTLHLDLLGVGRLTDASLGVLASGLPESLVDLKLDYSLCRLISKTGVESLAKNLPAKVSKLKASFTGTQWDTVFDSAAQLRKVASSDRKRAAGSMMPRM